MKSINHYKRLNNSKKSFTAINITPLTDIALVLLVVFMIATPMLIQSNINISLPKVQNKNDSQSKNSLVITIDKNSNIFIDNRKISLKDLKLFLKSYALKNSDEVVVVNGDKLVKYDMVVKVLDIVKNQGLKKVSLGIEVQS